MPEAPWPLLDYDIEKARDGIDHFAGDGASEMEAFERVATAARAAPDLLATLESIHELGCECYARINDRHGMDCYIPHARNAIAKARGGP